MERKRNLNESFLDELRKSHDRIQLVGSGTFGDVFVAEEKATKEKVAIKRLKKSVNNNNSSSSSYNILMEREISILRSLSHVNVMSIRDVIKVDDNDCVLMDCMQHDLGGLIQNFHHQFTYGQIKCYAKQLAEGVAYLHRSNILHRDLKPANILVSKNHIIKISDFGLACIYYQGIVHEDCEMVSLWYRAPEILMGSRNYSFEIDVWSYGCILVELLQKKPFLAGTSSQEQAQLVYEVFGLPWQNGWPECRQLSKWIGSTSGGTKQNLTDYFKKINGNSTYYYFTKEAIKLLERLFTYHPVKRIHMEDVVGHLYFNGEKPEPYEPGVLMVLKGENYSTLNKRKK